MAPEPLDWRLYAPFRRLVRVEVGGQVYLLPENNPLLRGFQFLEPDCLAYGRFCWNADCRTCVVRIDAGAPHGPDHYLACQVEPVDGMLLAGPPRGVRLPSPVAVRAYTGINDGGVVADTGPVLISDQGAGDESAGGRRSGRGGDPADVDGEGPGLGGTDRADPRP